MSSPSIDLDLDMSLLHSPVPPTRDGHGNVSRDDNGNAGQLHSSTVSIGFDGNNNMSGSNTNPSAEHGNSVTCGNGSYPSNATTSTATQRNHDVENNMSIAYGTAKSTSNDLSEPNSNGKPKQDHDETTRMVEAWREELYMMNVKNAILKDDLVKLGADA